MRYLYPTLNITESNSLEGGKVIYWKGKKICETESLHTVRGILDNQECFLLCTGPSIKELNIRALENKYVFGVNGASALLENYHISFFGYVITDPNFVHSRLELVKVGIDSGCLCFLTADVIHAILQHDTKILKQSRIILIEIVNKKWNTPSLPREQLIKESKKCELIFPPCINAHPKIGFSRNIELGFIEGCTVLFAALQIAYFHGCSTFYLIGLDISNSQDSPRFYEAKDDVSKSHLLKRYENVIKPSFLLASEVINQDGKEIYNLSPISRLPIDIIPKLTLIELSKHSKSYY